MLEKLIFISTLLSSFSGLAYINRAIALKSPEGKEVIMYGDVHLPNQEGDATQFTSIMQKKSLFNQTLPNIRFWYEGPLVESSLAQILVREKQSYFLACLSNLILQEQLPFKNIEIRNWSKEFHVLYNKVDMARGPAIAELKAFLQNSGMESQKNKLQTRLALLEYAQSEPASLKELGEAIISKLDTLIKAAETFVKSIKQAALQNELMLKIATCKEGSLVIQEAIERCLQTNYVESVVEGGLSIIGTMLFDILALRSILESSTDYAKQVLFAGSAHVEELSALLTQTDFNIIWQTGDPYNKEIETDFLLVQQWVEKQIPISADYFDSIFATT
jgi:hypothetical protein